MFLLLFLLPFFVHYSSTSPYGGFMSHFFYPQVMDLHTYHPRSLGSWLRLIPSRTMWILLIQFLWIRSDIHHLFTNTIRIIFLEDCVWFWLPFFPIIDNKLLLFYCFGKGNVKKGKSLRECMALFAPLSVASRCTSRFIGIHSAHSKQMDDCFPYLSFDWSEVMFVSCTHIILDQSKHRCGKPTSLNTFIQWITGFCKTDKDMVHWYVILVQYVNKSKSYSTPLFYFCPAPFGVCSFLFYHHINTPIIWHHVHV